MVEISVVQPQRIKREKLKLMTHHSHIRVIYESPHDKLHNNLHSDFYSADLNYLLIYYLFISI